MISAKKIHASRRIRRGLGSRRTGGFTMVEVLISVAISSLVVGAVISLQYISAIAIKEVYGSTRTRSSRMAALDQIKYRLADAQIGSCVVTQDDHRIEFSDPMLGGVTSALFFDDVANVLSYDDDINDNKEALEVVTGPIDITFQVMGAGEMVFVQVKTESKEHYGQVDEQDGEVRIYLRNS